MKLCISTFFGNLRKNRIWDNTHLKKLWCLFLSFSSAACMSQSRSHIVDCHLWMKGTAGSGSKAFFLSRHYACKLSDGRVLFRSNLIRGTEENCVDSRIVGSNYFIKAVIPFSSRSGLPDQNIDCDSKGARAPFTSLRGYVLPLSRIGSDATVKNLVGISGSSIPSWARYPKGPN